MDFRLFRQLVSLSDIRNAVVGLAVVFGGIGLALLTLYAHRTQNPELLGFSAWVSLIFVLLILIFVIPPLARNASKEASQLNLPFEFTGGGAIFLGLVAIVAFSAWTSGNNLLFLVLSFLTAAMIVGFFAGGTCLKKLDVRMRFAETIFAGEATKILVSIQNRKRVFPSYSIVAEVRGRERERSVAAADLEKLLPRRLARRLGRPPIVRRTLSYFTSVPRNETIEKSTQHVFPNRGRFLIKDFELSTRFPFGFFRHRRRLPARETELIVFPRLEPIEHTIENLPLEVGKLAQNRRGSGQDLLTLREYQANDDLRRIDWKATARTRLLTVKEFTAEDDTRIVIVFDPRVLRADGPKLTIRRQIAAEQRAGGMIESEKYEIGASRTASLIAHFADRQCEICLIIGNDVGKFGIGRRHLHGCLKRLAVCEPLFIEESHGEQQLFEVAELPDLLENSHGFLVTAFSSGGVSDEIVQRCNVIRF